jgi:hypothetical protein
MDVGSHTCPYSESRGRQVSPRGHLLAALAMYEHGTNQDEHDDNGQGYGDPSGHGATLRRTVAQRVDPALNAKKPGWPEPYRSGSSLRLAGRLASAGPQSVANARHSPPSGLAGFLPAPLDVTSDSPCTLREAPARATHFPLHVATYSPRATSDLPLQAPSTPFDRHANSFPLTKRLTT